VGVYVFYSCINELFFSYLAAVTIISDRAANLDLFLALNAFSSDNVPCLLQHVTSVFKVISKRPMILASKCQTQAKEKSIPFSKS
jgi:hypothetical protein